MKIKVINTGFFSVNSLVVFLDEKNVFVVDPACCLEANDQNVILDFLAQNNLVLCGIFLTHGHFDHIAGTKILKNAFPNVKIACHKNDSFMAGENAFFAQKETLFQMGLSEILPSIKNLPKIDVEFVGGEKLDSVFPFSDKKLSFLLSEWEIFHTPGHTQGSSVLYNPEQKILISGDTVFYHSYGRTDLPYGNENQMQKSLDFIYKNILPDTKVFPGHDYFGFELKENF